MKTYSQDLDEPDRERLFVGVSEYEVAADGETLVAYGLGACVGIVLYDPSSHVGGLAHPMLPRQSETESRTDTKFVDPVVETLLREVLEAGATYGHVEGYVVGGADLLDLQNLPQDVSDRNVAVAREELQRLDVPVVETAVGGTHGRTVELDTGTGELRVVVAHESDPRLLRRQEAIES